MDFNILDYGAVSDGSTLCTAAIQEAIENCTILGGRVVVPAGNFVTGTIRLRSNVELHLCHGARLAASTNLGDYNEEDEYEQNYGVPSEGWNAKHLVIAVECENVAITGTGVIDGRAECFFEEDKKFPEGHSYCWCGGMAANRDKVNLRPGQMLCFVECKRVVIQDVTLQSAPSWTCFLYGCDYVQVRGIKVFTKETYYLNVDGLDIDTCRYVTVSDCIIMAGDDAIAIRGAGRKLKNQERCCEHITITNCVLSSSACAFRIGVGTFPIRHVQVSNITIPYAGMCIFFNPEYSAENHLPIEDVNISNVSIEFAERVIDFRVEHSSVIKKVRIENVNAVAKSAVMMYSIPENAVSDICLENINVTAADNDHEAEIYLPGEQRKCKAFVKLYRINKLKLSNCNFEGNENQVLQSDNFLVAEECKNLDMSSSRYSGAENAIIV